MKSKILPHLLLTALLIIVLIGCPCSSTKIGAEVDTVEIIPTTSTIPPPPHSSRSYAPNTALVTASVLTHEEHEKDYACTVQIEKVHGYGSATPVIPKGEEVDIQIPKNLLLRLEKDPPVVLQKDTRLKMTLRSPLPGLQGESGKVWRVLALDTLD